MSSSADEAKADASPKAKKQEEDSPSNIASDSSQPRPDQAAQDVPPNLVGMPPVIWEEILSFLMSQTMCTAANRLSKALSGVDDPDRAGCLENAAKLALKDLMENAFDVYHAYRDENRGKVLHTEGLYGAGAPTCGRLKDWTPPKLDGESYHRTYHMACEMLHAGGSQILESWNDGRESNNGGYHVYIVAFLLYGAPALAPLDEEQTEIAEGIVHELTDVVAILSFRGDGSPDASKAGSDASKARLDVYCRGRILRIAMRLYAIGVLSGSLVILDLLTYGYPNNTDASLYDAEYFLGFRVVLHGLSKDELNGRAGEVEKAYNSTNQRIGIRLDCVEGESTGRLVGIKPTNLRPEEVDSDLVIDQKILAGLCSAEYTTVEASTYPFHMSREIHNLRRLSKTLTARIEASGETACAKYLIDSHHALYRCNILRLVNVQIALSRLLFYRACKVGCREISHDHGGVKCTATAILAAATANDENDTVPAGIATELLLREGVEALLGVQDLVVQFENLGGNSQVDLLGQALPSGIPTFSRIYPIKEYCFAFMHASVAILTHRLDIQFLHIENDDRTNLEEHGRRGVKCYREWIENFLSAMKDKVHPITLTIDVICSGYGNASLHPFVIRDFVTFLIGLTMHYLTCAAAGVPLQVTDECEELFYFLGLGVAIANRTLGSGHVFTKRWARNLQQLTEGEDSPVAWYSNPLEDPPEALENIIDAWLASDFRRLYS